MATHDFNELLARRQKMVVDTASILVGGAHIIQIQQYYSWVLINYNHNMVLAYGCGQQQIDNNKTYKSNAGNINHHADATVRCGAHPPMKHIPGFTRSHWI
jgi:hypothetical protein